MGRGTAAWKIMDRKAKERGWELVLGQEHYRYGREVEGYKKIDGGGVSKVVILYREELERWRSKNMVVLTIVKNNREELTVATVYSEPRSDWGQGIEEMLGWMGKRKERVVVGDDCNAKNEWWGGKETDMKGEQLLMMILENKMEILNDQDAGTTFCRNRGRVGQM